MISRQKCVMHIHTSKRKFGYDMCNAPDILINLRFIVSNLCTKSIIDANYGILSRLSRSDRFFKVNFARAIRFKVFKTLKFYSNSFSVPDFLWCCKNPRKVKFFRFFSSFRWQMDQNPNSAELRSFLANIRPNFLFIEYKITNLPNS